MEARLESETVCFRCRCRIRKVQLFVTTYKPFHRSREGTLL